jgi:hypothetical protein
LGVDLILSFESKICADLGEVSDEKVEQRRFEVGFGTVFCKCVFGTRDTSKMRITANNVVVK